MSNRGVQNAQLQGSQAKTGDTLDTRAAGWWSRLAEGDSLSRDGLIQI